MNALKIIVIIILVLIVIIGVLGLVAPYKYLVEKTTTINAPRDLVFSHIQYWKKWNAWSPWAEKDTTLKATYEGEDGRVGAIYKWKGDRKKSGTGELITTGIKANEEMIHRLHFIEPMESESEGYVRVSDEAGATKVTWGISGKYPFPWNITLLFMNMDKLAGEDFARGLELLKWICEKEFQDISAYKIKVVDFPATNYATIHTKICVMELPEFFSKSFGAIIQEVGKKRMKMIGACAGLYYTWDEATLTTDMAAAVPIKGKIETDNIKTVSLPETKAYEIDFLGPYSATVKAYEALDYYFLKNNLKNKPPIIEEYITDPAKEPDSTKWLTKIYYFAE